MTTVENEHGIGSDIIDATLKVISATVKLWKYLSGKENNSISFESEISIL